ncbi:sulfatase family protein [Mycobacterium xenopi 3993]|nr:sulfatase family protein [Mycobacterium xenopi 3993]
MEESNLASSKRHWPLSRGFERFYGFMGGETDQWYPDLVHDNHPVSPPAAPEDGYHLSKDIADKTIEFIRDAKVIAPDKPWFAYVCPAPGMPRTTCSPNGPTDTPAASTWATSATATSCWRIRSRSG